MKIVTGKIYSDGKLIGEFADLDKPKYPRLLLPIVGLILYLSSWALLVTIYGMH